MGREDEAAVAPVGAIAFHDSWPAAARALVLRAIDRHGGWSRWRQLEAISISLVKLWGFLPWAKGYQRTFTLPRSLTAFPHRRRVAFGDPDTEGRVALFEDGDMTLYDGAGAIAARSAAHRRSFRGLGKLRRWRPVDAFYFFGYAWSTYTEVPFVLPSLQWHGEVRGRWRGTRLRGVEVAFPEGAQVHSLRQRFFFDESGLLRRNDYTADIVGPFARGAHGWDDFATVDGFSIPARRTVLFRPGPFVLPAPVVLGATFEDISVRFAPAAQM
jgi:hypothetical protein